ncbi:MAG TPA: nodulation protein NfeD [Actinomycetota bacterium]|nr:nodulation protein NfeD [Actinomycetota bacterium]
MKRLAVGLWAAALLIWLGSGASAQTEHVVEVVDLEGVIDPTTAAYLESRFDIAEADGSEVVVIQLDTPGGLDVSMRDMVQEILRSPVPVVVWVGPPGARAASAGVFLVYASHVAAMAPGTNLGAAHPVDLGGELSGAVEEKAVSDAAALLRSLAEERGRSVAFTEATVRESEALTADEALDREVIEVSASSIPDLLRQLDGRTVETASGSRTLATVSTAEDPVSVRFHQPGLLTRILHAITDPTIAYLLLVLGFWALVFELSQPGVGVAGISGVVALLLAFYAFAVLPVNLAGLLLVLLGLVFFTIDVFTAGLGVWTIGGALALGAGSILLFGGVAPAIAVSPWVIAIVVAASVLFFGFAMTVAMRARRRPSVTGQQGLIGLRGEAREDLSPEGPVWVKGALWRGRALNGPIPKGSRIRVRRVDGLLLIVSEEKKEET